MSRFSLRALLLLLLLATAARSVVAATPAVDAALLRRVADAMDAELIVAMIPRQPISETLRARAREIARQEMRATVQSMRLENQEVGEVETNAQFDRLVENLMREPRKLWR